MKKTIIQKLEIKLKRQRTYYRNKILKLEKEIDESPSLYNENVASYHLLQHEFYRARDYINSLLRLKCSEAKLKEISTFNNNIEIQALADRNRSIQKRLDDLTLAYNRLVYADQKPPDSKKRDLTGVDCKGTSFSND